MDDIDSADKNMMTTVISQLAQFMALLKTEQDWSISIKYYYGTVAERK